MLPGDSVKRIIHCKVCNAVVPKRKRYHPKICEACQKFFTRSFRRRHELQCSSGTHKCVVESSNRRCCSKCRFEKCLFVGMQSKIQDDGVEKEHSLTSSGSPSSETRTRTCSSASSVRFRATPDPEDCELVDLKIEQSYPSAIVPFTREPMLYDGAAAEDAVRNCVHAFTMLHELEFLPMKRYTAAITDDASFHSLSLQQVYGVVRSGLSYANYMKGSYDLTNDHMKLILRNFLNPMATTFGSLPCHPDTTLDINEHVLSAILKKYPQFYATMVSAAKLKGAMTVWKPSLVECALFFGLLFFNEIAAANSAYIARIRQVLIGAFNLYCSRVAGGGSIAQSQRYFMTSVKLVDVTVQAATSYVESIYQMDRHNFDAFDQRVLEDLFLVKPERPHAGDSFKKLADKSFSR